MATTSTFQGNIQSPQYVTPEKLTALDSQLQDMRNINTGAIQMQAKQYFEPVVRPLVQEGAKRFQDTFGGLNSFLNAPGSDTSARPEARMGYSQGEIGRAMGQYEANRGMRDYYNTRAENMGALASQGLRDQYGMAQDEYNRIYSRYEGNRNYTMQNKELDAKLAEMEWSRQMEQKKFDEMVRQFNSRNSGGGGGDSWRPGEPIPTPIPEPQDLPAPYVDYEGAAKHAKWKADSARRFVQPQRGTRSALTSQYR